MTVTTLDRSLPQVTYRVVGDAGLTVEYGREPESHPDLTINFLVHAVTDRIRGHRPVGLLDITPTLRSLMITFDPDVLTRGHLIGLVKEIHAGLPDLAELTLPSRLLHLPITFDDAHSREAVSRYQATIRADAPNCENGNNIDYLVRYNGLADRRELYRLILGTEWWNAFTGFFAGLPFMVPLDTRTALTAPKYNPSRTWTAEGTVGLGGPCLAIYPIDAPGGYQVIGRTLRIFDPRALSRPGAEYLALGPGDRVRFEEVDHQEIDELRRAMVEGRFRLWADEQRFSVADYLDDLRVHAPEAVRIQRERSAAARLVEVP